MQGVLSYQHTYHAGNHADALKHVVLLEVLAAMQKKESPLFVLDAFAGQGLYQLDSEQAMKNREFDTGIGKLWAMPENIRPAAVRRWLDMVTARNPEGILQRYPGSSALIGASLREQDRMAACEMHPQEFDLLRKNFSGSRRFTLHKRDAYEALKALLPPKEGRGLVFLDPAYEVKDEYGRIARAVGQACRHFRAGVYMIWYPQLPQARHRELFRQLKGSGVRKILRVEMDGGNSFAGMQMHGSGLLIINPPWQVQQSICESASWLCSALADNEGKTVCEWLVPE